MPRVSFKTVSKICQQCSNEFFTYPYRTEVRFCSKICSSRGRGKNGAIIHPAEDLASIDFNRDRSKERNAAHRLLDAVMDGHLSIVNMSRETKNAIAKAQFLTGRENILGGSKCPN